MMKRFAIRLACLLWITTTLLLPGSGWALCISSTGHMAVEFAGVDMAGSLAAKPTGECGDECSPDECKACNDIHLESLDRTCSRRDVDTPASNLAPLVLDSCLEPGKPRITDPGARGAVGPIPPTRAHHLFSVLKR